MQKKGLGKGLGALIPTLDETPKQPGDEGILRVEVGRIKPNPFQPRQVFDDERIEELAASIRDQGIIQPLLVRRSGDGYELIAGERRLRAATKAGLQGVPVIIRDVDDNEALQLALVENVQREDLNAIEEARAYQTLQEKFLWKHEEIAEKVGKSRPAITNAMRLLLLPEEIQQEVVQGRLAAGQARALLALEREELILAAAREILNQHLTTRQVENLVARMKLGRRRRKESVAIDPDLRSVAEKLQQWLGTRVRLFHKQKSGKGKIEIEYYSLNDFERIMGKLSEKQIS